MNKQNQFSTMMNLRRRLYVLVLLVFSAMTLEAQTSDEIKTAEKNLKKYPKNPVAYFNLGAALVEAEKYQEAVLAFKQAISLKANFVEAHFALGMAYNDLENYDAAIESMKETLKLKSKFKDAALNLGILYGRAGRTSEAVEALKYAAKLMPDSISVYYNIAAIALKSDSATTDAIDALNEILRLKPADLDAQKMLAESYRKLKRYDEAIAIYTALIKQNSTDADAMFGLGITFVNAKKRPEAFKQHAALKLLDSAKAKMLIELIYVEMPKRQQDAVKTE
jgi:tetratricopeptide (TPR) repeat protein